MRFLKRTSDEREDLGYRVFVCLFPGLVSLALAYMLFYYQSAWLAGLKWVLLIGGVLGLAYGIYHLLQFFKIKSFDVQCPFCEAYNIFTEKPMEDVRCSECNRQIPIVDGHILQVFQVRCGYCNTLNWYNDTSTGLICEECDRVIPIAGADESASPALKTFTRHDETLPYDLVLIDGGRKEEDLIPVLQQMLALNRNHVKNILNEIPVVLLQGVPKRKADLLAMQIQVHGGSAESRPSGSS